MKRILYPLFSLCVLSIIFFACNKELSDQIVKYKGQVVYLGTSEPFSNVEVKLTDGENINTSVLTDAGGFFSMKVDVSTINGSYYILAGDSTCILKKVNLPGYGQAEIDLGVIEVEGPHVPTVTTSAIVSLTADEVTMGGIVTSDGRSHVTQRGICYATTTDPTIENLHTINGEGLGEFVSNLTKLEYSTIYYARAYAINKVGVGYGEQIKFTTEAGVAIVITDSVYNITANSVRVKAHVQSDGGFNVTKRGVCWSKNADPTLDDNFTEEGSGVGEFTSALRNLTENTTYYIRSYATNSTKTSYGEQFKITTLDGLPVVKTDSVVSVKARSVVCHGTVVSDCDIPVTNRGFCYSKSQYPTIDEAQITTSGKGLGAFKNTLNNLELGTTYYIRAYATNATETTYGEQIMVTTLSGLPTVTTADVTNIGSVKASCGGEVTDDGTLSVIARGICYGTTQQPTIEDSHTTDGTGKGVFTSSLKNLSDKTTYYVRAYATTEAGTSYGEQRTFKTEDGIPVVELTALRDTTATSIVGVGKVTGDGGLTITERGFCYSTSQYPTTTGSHIAIGNGMGEFTGTLSGLSINTKYYVRAYATNSIGTAYSTQMSFVTCNGLPVVSTSSVSSVKALSALVTANVTSDGGFAISARGLCWSTSSNPTLGDNFSTNASGIGSYTYTISELSPSTKYYVRAYATNSVGTSYANELTFTTPSGLPDLSTTSSSSTAFSITVGGNITDNGGYAVAERGVCYSQTNADPSLTDPHVSCGSGNGTFSTTINELSANTTYYVRAYARNSVGVAYGASISVQTSNGSAQLTTSAVTNIMALSATSGVSVTDAGGAAIQSCGICWGLTTKPTLSSSHVEGGKTVGTFTCQMSGLTPSTKYYVRAYATTDVTTTYGNEVTFTTKSGLPTLTTTSSSVTAFSITVGGNITDNGGYSVTERGVCYSQTNAEPSLMDSYVSCGSGNGTFNTTINELSPNTTYYVRAYAKNSVGTEYSNAVTVKTKTGVASLTTATITNIMALSATGCVNVTDAGGATLQACGICWSTTQNPTSTSSHVQAGSSLGTHSCNLTDLSPSTTYYVRAYATTNVTTSYGNQVSFRTSDGLPAVSTASTTATSTTITSGGNVTSDGGYAITARGVVYSTTNAAPTLSDGVVTSGRGVGSFSSTVASLQTSTTYYVRAYATNQIGTSYGAVTSVRTGDGLPQVVTTYDDEAITLTAIPAGGQVVDDGGYTVTSRGIVYGTTPNPTISSAKVVSGSGKGFFSCSVTGVNMSSTTYHIRAYATNANGTVYGEDFAITPEMYQYCQLPTMVVGGDTYRIYTKVGTMDHNAAMSTCNTLSYGAHTGWKLPSNAEGAGILAAFGVNTYFPATNEGLQNIAIDGKVGFWLENRLFSDYAALYKVEARNVGSMQVLQWVNTDIYYWTDVPVFAVRKCTK